MGDSNDANHVAASGAAVSHANRCSDRPIEVPADLPGIVIFIHGVNDPGAVYSFVEEGLCQGLNERLDRRDLKAGSYGESYKNLKQKKDPNVVDAKILADPDTFLYQRKEITGKTKSVFIPFYWGYRASDDEIARIDSKGKSNTDKIRGGTDDGRGFLTMRGQYQDLQGNRLDKNFGKGGGFFANATNNIPDMYGQGFRADRAARTGTRLALSAGTLYAADGPDRRYFVMAATRLARLIRLIRSIEPSALAKGKNKVPGNETITIMGHSQGTILTLLAQAILRKDGERCVDCVIMVDSPYSLYQTPDCNQTGQAKLQTLINIVNEVTSAPYRLPDLADLLITNCESGGRAGPKWKPSAGSRLEKSGKQWVTFDERDNRGKVYLYFCPEDTVVGMSKVHGIGTFGIPDVVPADGTAKTQQNKKSMDAMKALAKHGRFLQRMWTRMERIDPADGKRKKVLVGTKPGSVPVREIAERLNPGPADGISNAANNLFMQDKFIPAEMRYINGEELKPPCEPDLYGGEIKGRKGGPDRWGNDRIGMAEPDDVTQNVILGNQYASMKWKQMDVTNDVGYDLEKAKRDFNAKNPSIDDQAHHWRLQPILSNTLAMGPVSYTVEREETPNEARKRMKSDEDVYQANNYHSAILHATENQRWVTAMDVAIGQAVTLDDPVWRELILAIADWKLSPYAYSTILANRAYKEKLSQENKDFITACKDYYQSGTFPAERFVSMAMPDLVVNELTDEALKARYESMEPDIRFYQNQVGTAFGNLGNMR